MFSFPQYFHFLKSHQFKAFLGSYKHSEPGLLISPSHVTHLKLINAYVNYISMKKKFKETIHIM